jgi:hypothetical protein
MSYNPFMGKKQDKEHIVLYDGEQLREESGNELRTIFLKDKRPSWFNTSLMRHLDQKLIMKKTREQSPQLTVVERDAK